MLIFVMNPTAGGGKAAAVMDALGRLLRQRGVAYEVLRTEAAGDGERLARQAAARGDCDAVVSVGGDGTAYEVASGMLDSGKPMGLIPCGTGNDFIKSLNYPKDPARALELVLKGQAKPVDLVTLNDRCFLNVSGTGFDVTVLQQA